MDWIPTTERLPTKAGMYLCCWMGTYIDTARFGINGHRWTHVDDDRRELGVPTHWMPLPSLPGAVDPPTSPIPAAERRVVEAAVKWGAADDADSESEVELVSALLDLYDARAAATQPPAPAP